MPDVGCPSGSAFRAIYVSTPITPIHEMYKSPNATCLVNTKLPYAHPPKNTSSYTCLSQCQSATEKSIPTRPTRDNFLLKESTERSAAVPEYNQMPYIGSRLMTSPRYVPTGSATRRVGGSSPEEMRQAMSNNDHRVRPKIGVPVVIRGRKNVPMPTIATARTASRALALSSSLRDGDRVVSGSPLGIRRVQSAFYPDIDLIMPNVLRLADRSAQRTLLRTTKCSTA